MRIEPEFGGCSIVFLGRFNPAIFSPAWFARNKLISEAAEKEAAVNVIHTEIASMRVDKIQIQVEINRLSAEVTEAPWIDLSDFMVRTFGEFLGHTPINQMGINRLVHFGVGSEEKRNAIGLMLAPLGPWGAWGEEISKSRPPLRGGMTNLTMVRRKESQNGISGHVQVQVKPSKRISGNSGIYMHVNDHYDFGRLEEIEGATAAMEILSTEFEESLKRSEAIIDQLMSLKG